MAGLQGGGVLCHTGGAAQFKFNYQSLLRCFICLAPFCDWLSHRVTGCVTGCHWLCDCNVECVKSMILCDHCPGAVALPWGSHT